MDATLSTLTASYDSVVGEYRKTPARLVVLDAYAACALGTAAILFLYANLLGTFPFNAFLAAFFCCLGCFVLTLSLRMQASGGGGGSASGGGVMDGTLLGGYALAMATLFLAAFNYIG